MYPELFRIGTLTVHSYGAMIALAVLVAALALYREAPREGLDGDTILEGVIAATFFGLLGARLLYLLLNWDYYGGQIMSSFFTQFEGLSYYGGFIGGAGALYLWSRLRRTSFLQVADLLAPYLALGYAFGRVGCFLNGCCYGLPSDLPWAMAAGMHDDILRHPVQLYAALGSILIFVILKGVRSRRPWPGFQLLLLTALYGLLRFSTEFFRQGEPYLAWLTQAQVFSATLLVLALAALLGLSFYLPARLKEGSRSERLRKKKSASKE